MNVLKNSATYYCEQAQRQYLDNDNEAIDVVVFGHTHIPQIQQFENGKLYLNAGAWTDHNPYSKNGMSRTFAVISERDGRMGGSLFHFNEMNEAVKIR